jgi:hypothetical protein
VFLVILMLVVALFGVSMCASAATITWTNPTTRVDGSPLPASQLDYTDIQWGTCNGLEFGDMLGSIQAPAPASVFDQALPYGTVCTRLFAVDKDGLRSDSSHVFSYVRLTNPPEPPQVLRVIWGAAFKVHVMPNGRIFLPYDTGESARYGAPCLAIPGLTEVYGFGLSEGVIAVCE